MTPSPAATSALVASQLVGREEASLLCRHVERTVVDVAGTQVRGLSSAEDASWVAVLVRGRDAGVGAAPDPKVALDLARDAILPGSARRLTFPDTQARPCLCFDETTEVVRQDPIPAFVRKAWLRSRLAASCSPATPSPKSRSRTPILTGSNNGIARPSARPPLP